MKKTLRGKKLVSIILPAYNTEDLFLRQAVDSVIAQTYENWELLIIDDSTTSPVENIINSYSDQRIKYFRNPQNLGMANSRNRGLELAQGEFIALLDHDDIWLPEKLSEQIKTIRQHNCNMVYSPVAFFGNSEYCSIIQHNVSFENLLNGHNIVSCSCVLIRSEILRNFDLKFQKNAVPADDYAMWLAIALYGGTIECTDKYLVRYRKHNDNVSGNPLVCYYPYEWILSDITCKLFNTSHPLTYKLRRLITILRSRTWVLRKIIKEDSSLSPARKLKLTLKAVMLWPLNPKNWLLLLENIFKSFN